MATTSGASSGPGPKTGSGSAESDRNTSALAPTLPLINLLRGWPAPELLPAAELQTAATRVLTDPALFVPSLEYGADPGYELLREELAAYLAKTFSPASSASSSPSSSPSPDTSRICITGGASQNIASILQSFTDPAVTRAIWIAAPCYFLACPIFEDAGFAGRLRAVPEDAEGIDLARLEKGFRETEHTDAPPAPPSPSAPAAQPLKPRSSARRIYRHIVYVVPTASNPSGRSMTLARRTELVRLARRHDALIIADDVYDFLQWPTRTTETDASDMPLPPARLPRLVDLDRQLPHDGHEGHPFGNVVSNGSFSKIGGPGLRTGWAEATPAFAYGLSQTGCTRSGGAPSQLCASLLAEMMRSGALDRHLRRVVRPALQRRHRLLADAVAALLEEFVEVESAGPEPSSGSAPDNMAGPTFAGYFLWLRLRRPGLRADDVAARARVQENLVVAPGSLFTVKGDEAAVPFDHHLRLCFAYEDERRLVEGVERLARVLRNWDAHASVPAAPADDGDRFK